MAEATKAAARRLPAFKLGRKQVFLPFHRVIMLRKERLPPNEACFQVPLRFTKFDLRDYLWNLYKVEVTKSLKIMNVELSRPFQWPEVPRNLDPWSNEVWKMRQEIDEENMQESYDKQKAVLPMQSQKPMSPMRQELASLAQKMLSGEVKWKNDVILDPKWDKVLPKARGGDAGGR